MCAEATAWRIAPSGTVVGTPALCPEDVARLARALYHADPQVIDETSERGADGTWRYRDPRMQRVANALTRAELTRVRASQPAAAVRRARRGDAVRGGDRRICP
jgi:hypothetical protein